MATPEVPLGAKVQVTAGIGVVRWAGSNPGFAAGKWVGVELDSPAGKNDGSVKGERYFECKPNHGVFVRPSQVKILEEPKPSGMSRQSSMGPPPVPTLPRSRSGTISTSRPPSVNAKAGPSTPPRSARSVSHTSPGTATAATSHARRPSTASTSGIPASRPSSVASVASTARRIPSGSERRPSITEQSVPIPTPSAPKESMPPPRIPSGSLQALRRPSASLSDKQTSGIPAPAPNSATIQQPKAPDPPESAAVSESLPPVRTDRPPSPEQESSSTAFANKREVEELRIKIRLLESRRAEDQERIKSLETKAGEADTLRAARVKLQAKFQELQSSLMAAQRQARDLQTENSQSEQRASEAFDQLEMAALDREVAEEKAEASEAEIIKLNERIEELELEVAVLKEENAEYEKPVGGMEGERTSLAFVQLEKHNERLKEALIRLRDVSSENEKDQKSRISELEKQLNAHSGLPGKLEVAQSRLRSAEEQIEDLKIQLDDALGAEDMLEQLTERNLQMGEKIEEMRVTIEDLEALKELNDELEENHTEAEKQLNAEIDTLNLRLREEKARSAELDRIIIDMEATINQFRDLVADLQSEIDMLQSQQISKETESASNSKEAQALMNLNMKLQSSASKAQSKTVDLELKKTEALILAEHLKIVTAYLPDPYLETEADSTTLYLFFRRLSYKLDLLITVISQIHGLPNSLQNASSEVLVGICELRGRLRYFSTLNTRFAAVMIRNSPDGWISLGKVLPEITGVENRIDSWITSIKSDEFNERDCVRDLSSLVAQFDHLANTTFNLPNLDIGEQQLEHAYSFDYDLDNFAAAIGFARQAIKGLVEEDDLEIVTSDGSLDDTIYAPAQRVLDQVRTVKGSSTLASEIQGLVDAGSHLPIETGSNLIQLNSSISGAVDMAIQLAQRIGAHVSSIRSSKEPFKTSDIERILREVTSYSTDNQNTNPWDHLETLMNTLGSELSAIMQRVRSAIKSGQVITVNVPPPYLARVAMIKEAAQFNAETERKVVKLTEEVKDMLREIKLRDQTLQESGVKVETLERRLEASRKQADMIIELENDVAKAKKQEKVYADAIEQLQAEQDALEAENAKLRKGQGTGDRTLNATNSAEPLILSASGVDSAQTVEQIENLRSAIRFLRSENAFLKSKQLYKDIHLLPTVAYRALEAESDPPVPALDPSSPGSPASSTSSSDEILLTPTKYSIRTESKLLWKEVAEYTSKSKIVDISQLGKGGWHSRKHAPEVQLWQWREEERRLGRKVEGLKERLQRLQNVSRIR